MLTGTHRLPKQDQVVYGRPAAEVVRLGLPSDPNSVGVLPEDFQAIADRNSPRSISGAG